MNLFVLLTAISVTAMRLSISRRVRRFMILALATLAGSVSSLAQNTPPTVRFARTVQGAILMTGNALITCRSGQGNCDSARQEGVNGSSTNNNRNMEHIDIDSDPSTFNSSSADVDLPNRGTVLFAVLAWGGVLDRPSGPDTRTEARMKAPGSIGYTSISGSLLGEDDDRYFAAADVTSQVRAGLRGTYTVANVQTETGDDDVGLVSGWSLVIVYEDLTLPLRNLSVYTGFGSIEPGDAPLSTTISGFVVPPTGTTIASVGLVGMEGDRGLGGDNVRLSGERLFDDVNRADNLMNSTISSGGQYITNKNPNYSNQLGWDSKTIQANGFIPNGATSATVSLGTEGDIYQIALLTLSVDLHAPVISSTKTAANLTVPGGLFAAGHTIEYTVSSTQTGVDTGTQTVLVDSIHPNTAYVPGSLEILSGPPGSPIGPQTGDIDEDAAEYLVASRTVRFRLGANANGTEGGTLAQGQSTSIRFKVRILPNVAFGTIITNTATTTTTGLTSGQTINASAISTVTVGSPPDLTIQKSHTGQFAAGGTGSYTLLVQNLASSGAAGTVTVTDTMPTGLTVTGVSGNGWGCTGTPQAISCSREGSGLLGNFPPLTVTVAIAPNAPPIVVNTATVSGGGDVSPANNTSSDPTTIAQLANLTISKTHSGNFTSPQTGAAYSIVVSNLAGAGPTAGTVTVSDAMPAGLTATAASGTGWNCIVGATVTCTRSDVLVPGSSYPAITLTVNVAANAPATITNTVTVSGGGDATPANNTASDPATIIPLANLTITKTHSGNFTSPQTGAAYGIVVSNAAGAGPTAGIVTVSDPLPAGLTATAASGAGWNCIVGATVTCTRSDVLTPGSSYPSITLTVNVAADAPATITNTVTVSGGGDVTPANNTASDPAIIIELPDLSITKTHSGEFTSPQTGAAYSIVVSNAAGGGPTLGLVTVSDAMPAGLTATAASGAGWNCNVGATVTCTRTDVLAPGSSYPAITLTVNVAAGAPATIINTAVVNGAGDMTPANNSASDPALVVPLPDLRISKTHAGTLTPGQVGGTYSIVVSNSPSAGPSVGNVTVTDPLPASLTATAATGDGWNCTVGATTVCTRSDTLGAGASYPPITLTVNVAANAPPVIINTATVSGARDTISGNDTAVDVSGVADSPDLTVVKSHSGTLIIGQPVTYSIVVSNDAAAGPTVGTVTLTDPLPERLTVISASGTGWNCTLSATVSCSRSDVLIPGSSYPAITLTANVTAGGATIISNVATVSGGADVTPGNNSSTDTAPAIALPDLTISKAHAGTLTPGQVGATYSILVSNAAAAGPSIGAVTVTDPLPASLTATAAAGDGWTCSVGPTTTCTRTGVLAPGANFPPITLTVNVAPDAPLLIINTATVSGGGDNTPENNTDADVSRRGIVPELTISKSHSGTVIAGQTTTFNIVVSNLETAGPTSGPVIVTDKLPAGLTAISASGLGWTCSLGPTGSCARSDVLDPGTSYPPISLVVSVAPGVSSTSANIATVSGGGDLTPRNNSAIDPFTPTAFPDLSITKSPSVDLTPGQVSGGYRIVVSNAATAGPTTGTVTVTDLLPTGLAAISVSGAGWACGLNAVPLCMRSDVLAPGASYPEIMLGVQIAGDVPSPIVNVALVAGGGDVSPANNFYAHTTRFALAPPDLTITKSHSGNFARGQTGATYGVAVTNIGSGPSYGIVTVSDSIPAGLTATAAAGDGWNCTVGPTVVCTRSNLLPVGASYPPITLTVNVAPDAPLTITNVAAVSSTLDNTPGNNSASDTTFVGGIAPGPPGPPGPPEPTDRPDLTITKSHVGAFFAGQNGTFSIVVSNAGAAPTSSPVTVTDTMPGGLTAVSAGGTGWNCTVGPTVTCGRSDILRPNNSYPPIALVVNVAPNAPGTISNTATVSGGGDISPRNNTAFDSVSIVRAPDLSIIKSHSGDFTAGQTGAPFTIVVSNAAGAGPTSGTVTVADTLPAGLTATSSSGPGWACTVSGTVTCTRSDVLLPGASYPPITLVVSVAPDASGTLINTATVSGGGDGTPANNTDTDEIVIVPVTTSVTPEVEACSSKFVNAVRNPIPPSGVETIIVTNTISPEGKPVIASGMGWECSIVGQVATCTRPNVLVPGGTLPAITVTVDFLTAAPGTIITDTSRVVAGTASSTTRSSFQVPVPTAVCPRVTLVTNAASFITPGHSNYGIAPGSVIAIFGHNIGPETQASREPFPLDPPRVGWCSRRSNNRR